MACLVHSLNFHSSKLIVLDLDLTLWKFQLDKHMKSPFQYDHRGKVIDLCGKEPKLMEGTVSCLDYLHKQGYQVGIASRIKDICGAYQLLNYFDIAKYFHYREIYPGCKKRHFLSLQQKSSIEFKNMVFFDDDWRNIRDVSTLGVLTVHVPQGISEELLRNAVESLS